MKTPESVIRRLKEVATQFSGDGCWEWPRYRNPKSGYGQLSHRVNGATRQFTAHRASYEAFVGEIPNGLCVCHKCDNGPCFNPSHLFLGTHKENMHDMIRKGRGGKINENRQKVPHWMKTYNGELPLKRGEENNKAKLTAAEVMMIMSSDKSANKLSAELGVSRTTIDSVRKGRTWRHVTQGVSQYQQPSAGNRT